MANPELDDLLDAKMPDGAEEFLAYLARFVKRAQDDYEAVQNHLREVISQRDTLTERMAKRSTAFLALEKAGADLCVLAMQIKIDHPAIKAWNEALRACLDAG